MNRYKITKQLGDGTYGSVLKAVNRQTGEVVRTPPLLYFPSMILLTLGISLDGSQENEEEILYVGRVYATPRGEGTYRLFVLLPYHILSLIDILEFKKIKSSKYCEIEGSYS